ncbi:hypothetical protein CCMSSC00406_0010043 [Pleurotus cornucopiae]|uniref:Uncharacterized protein n=1 Tax=Pleurotus cornucopiae TaxID=5321 RepID=A0ACB7IL59_PLECO|nr:hypothetical protein CCMSSC00406_0010043 [Pleurotus cornucopiae]
MHHTNSQKQDLYATRRFLIGEEHRPRLVTPPAQRPLHMAKIDMSPETSGKRTYADNQNGTGRELRGRVADLKPQGHRVRPSTQLPESRSFTPATVPLRFATLFLLVTILLLVYPKRSAMTQKPSGNLSQRNYASMSSGARVIGALTSETFDPRPPSALDTFFAPILYLRKKWTGFDFSKIHLSLPRDAFTDNERCWEFGGSYGHVAVSLAKPTYLSHASMITPFDVVSSDDQKRLTKHIVLWGLVEHSQALSYTDSRSPFYFSHLAALPPDIPPTHRFVRLVDIQYNISRHDRNALHPIIPSARATLFQILVFESLSNQGGTTTCLYYAGVHKV